MASSVVFVFLLDNLPGNILNRTLEDIRPLGHNFTNFGQCHNDSITNEILRIVDKKLNFKIVPQLKFDHDFTNLYYLNKSQDILKETSAETLYNIQTVLDNSIGDDNSDSFQNFIEDNIRNEAFSNEKSDCENTDLNITFPGKYDTELKYPIKANAEVSEDFPRKVNGIVEASDSENTVNITFPGKYDTELNLPIKENAGVSEDFPGKANGIVVAKVKYPECIPGLVAIFETLGNVTAQTCGGTAISPHWILTAASCLNVLENLYNITNSTSKSHYTIIANATNPLIDGTVHNVTRIILHPTTLQMKPHIIPTPIQGLFTDLHQLPKGKRDEKSPTLALMRVEPELRVDIFEILRDKMMGIGDVMVYGWILTKNDPGNSDMYATSFPATTLRPFDCEIHYGIMDTKSVLCLSPSNDTEKDLSQMSSGGPVLSIQDNRIKLVAVAQTDDRTPFIGYPLYTHAAWVTRIVGSK